MKDFLRKSFKKGREKLKLKIGTKIMTGYVLVLILLTALAIYAYLGMEGMENNYNEILDNNMPAIVSVWKAQNYEQELRGLIRAFMLYQKPQHEDAFYKTDKDFRNLIVEMEKLARSNETQKYVAKLKEHHNKYFEEASASMNHIKAGENDKVVARVSAGLSHAQDFDKTAAEFTAYIDKLVAEKNSQAKSKAANTQSISAFITVIAIILGIGIGIYLTRSISKPVVLLTGATNELARGDLTITVPTIKTGDELEQLGQAFSSMVNTLRDLLIKISGSAQQVTATGEELSATTEQVSAAVQQVAVTMEELSKGHLEQTESVNQSASLVEQMTQSIDQIATGAQEQAKNVSQTSIMIEEMAKGIDDVAANTQQVADGARIAANTAAEGGHAVEKTIMQRIKATVFESANRIKELGEQSQQIGEIIQVIDDIAEQTNLLALNAAIEAARAGEHGKGFAVVADEVRKLAERSGKATKEIATLINNIQKGTSQAVNAMELGTREVETGTVLADDAGKALQAILANITQASDQIQSISAAIEQVSASSAEVVTAVDNVAAITEQNTAATEEMSANSTQVENAIDNIAAIAMQSSASAQQISTSTEEITASTAEITGSAQSLSAMALELQGLVNRFKL